jgi:hypothetical protein
VNGASHSGLQQRRRATERSCLDRAAPRRAGTAFGCPGGSNPAPRLQSGGMRQTPFWTPAKPPRWATTFRRSSPRLPGRPDWYCCIAKNAVRLSYGKLRNNRAGRPSRLRRRDRRSRWRPANRDRLQDPGRRRGLDGQRRSVEHEDRSRRVSRPVVLRLSRRYVASFSRALRAKASSM